VGVNPEGVNPEGVTVAARALVALMEAVVRLVAKAAMSLKPL